MMKIMIISDTHKNQEFLRKAFEIEEDLTHIFHLGDSYDDITDNIDLLENRTLTQVPGLYHEGYLNNLIPRVQTVELENWNFQLVHFLSDIKKIPIDLDVIFYGHTHRWNFRKLDDIHFVNPGHLKCSRDRGRDASYLILEVTPEKLEFNFKYLDHSTFLKKTINR